MFMAILSFLQCQVTGCFLHLMTMWLWDLTQTAQSAQYRESGYCVGGMETAGMLHFVYKMRWP